MSGDHMPYAELDDWRRQLSREVIRKDERIAALETENAALKADAQLARDLREIEAAGYSMDTCQAEYGYFANVYRGEMSEYFDGDTREEAVTAALKWVKEQKAAEWAEGKNGNTSKISICSRCGGRDPECYICKHIEAQKEAE